MTRDLHKPPQKEGKKNVLGRELLFLVKNFSQVSKRRKKLDENLKKKGPLLKGKFTIMTPRKSKRRDDCISLKWFPVYIHLCNFTCFKLLMRIGG